MVDKEGHVVDCPLKELINRASNGLTKILDSQFTSDAHFVRTTGNDSVHGKVGQPTEAEALEVLTKIRFLLTLLYPQSI